LVLVSSFYFSLALALSLLRYLFLYNLSDVFSDEENKEPLSRGSLRRVFLAIALFIALLIALLAALLSSKRFRRKSMILAILTILASDKTLGFIVKSLDPIGKVGRYWLSRRLVP